jgi:putative glycosyltransferase (TIGR04372 family)
MIVWKFKLHRENNPDRPFRIFAALLHRTFGDFVDQLLFAATIKQRFPSGSLDVTYRPDRTYKADLIKLAPQVDRAWPMPDGMPLDYFDTAANAPVALPKEWTDSLNQYTDLILTPGMCRFIRQPSLGEPARFRVPDAERWQQQLTAKVGPGWFVVIHYREPGYALRPHDTVRDFRIDDALPVYEAILGAGGQVVRIGHPGMTALPDRPGLIDLASDELMLQAAAIERARFFMELSPSGPAHLALPLGCPLLRCNVTDVGRTFEDRAVGMPQRVINANGEDVTLEIIKQGMFNRPALKLLDGHRLEPNSADQLVEGAAMMIKHTTGAGWRSPGNPASFEQPGELTLPLENHIGLRLMV